MAGGKVQHWKHGWIPVSPEAKAFAAGKGPRPGSGGITAEQYAALQPRRGGWTTSTRQKTLETLRVTPEGRRLASVIDHYQNASGSSALPRLRSDIDKHLSGGELPAGRHESIQTLLDAIKGSPGPSDRPLYRGMVASGTPDDVLGRYAPGAVLPVSLASFTSDPSIAASFSVKGAGQRVTGTTHTPVVFEWGGPKRALPIENLAPSRVFANEREWLTSGRYRVQASGMARRGGRNVALVRLTQEAS